MLTFGRRRYWGEPCSEAGFALQQVSVRRLWRARGGCWPSPGARCQTMAAHSLAELEIAIRASWSRWTSDPVDHAVCSAERPARGQVRSPRRPGPACSELHAAEIAASTGRPRDGSPRRPSCRARAAVRACWVWVAPTPAQDHGSRGSHGARSRGRSQRRSRVRAAVTPAIMSERAFGLGNRRESRKQGVRVHRRRPGCSCGFCRNRGRSVETKKHRGRWR